MFLWTRQLTEQNTLRNGSQWVGQIHEISLYTKMLQRKPQLGIIILISQMKSSNPKHHVLSFRVRHQVGKRLGSSSIWKSFGLNNWKNVGVYSTGTG